MNGRRGSGCKGRADGVVSTQGTWSGVVVNGAQRENGVWDVCVSYGKYFSPFFRLSVP